MMHDTDAISSSSSRSRKLTSSSCGQRSTIDPILTLNVSSGGSRTVVTNTTNNKKGRDVRVLGDPPSGAGTSSSPYSSPSSDEHDDSLPPGNFISTLTGLCFLSANTSTPSTGTESLTLTSEYEDTTDDSSTSSSDDEGQQATAKHASSGMFRCQQLQHQQQQEQSSLSSLSPFLLSGRLLGTCHSDGSCCVWDLAQRTKVADIVSATTTSSSSSSATHNSRLGPGLALRRLSDTGDYASNFFYQTRDPDGTISLHDWNHHNNNNKPLSQFRTQSRSFCAAAPCVGDPHLIVLPAEDLALASVRDWRVSPRDAPVALFHATEGVVRVPSSSSSSSVSSTSPSLEFRDRLRRHGMLTSLAMMATATNISNSHVIACGMESGTVAFHDLAMLRGPLRVDSVTATTTTPGSIRLDPEAPVLSVDLSPSNNMQRAVDGSSLVAVAGLASSMSSKNEDHHEQHQQNHGRVALIKVRQQVSPTNDNLTNVVTWKPRLRTRLQLSTSSSSTAATTTTNTTPCCNPPAQHHDEYHHKRGAAVCRFRPDGRLVAVGGWDYRVHLYDRTTSQKLAILRGHTESVRTLDWAPDADASGLLATGSGDGWVHVWRCFPSPLTHSNGPATS